jgi:hypothetical protein
MSIAYLLTLPAVGMVISTHVASIGVLSRLRLSGRADHLPAGDKPRSFIHSRAASHFALSAGVGGVSCSGMGGFIQARPLSNSAAARERAQQ